MRPALAASHTVPATLAPKAAATPSAVPHAAPNVILRDLANMGMSSAEFQLAKFYFDHKNFSQAAHWFQQSVNSGYEIRVSQFDLALSDFDAHHYEQANQVLSAYVGLFSDPSAYRLLGVTYVMLNQRDKALYWLQKAAMAGDKRAKSLVDDIHSHPTTKLVAKGSDGG